MELSLGLVILATVAGPILAVQAQKAVERIRERQRRKEGVFARLMATRAARVSPEHVQALNMIDLVFYGRRIFGIHRRTKSEQAVLDAWREYLDHLGTSGTPDLWLARGEELLTNLLFAMAKDAGFRFDRVQLKKGVYAPVAHETLQLDQAAIRKAVLRILSGEQAIKVDAVSPPRGADAKN